ncbi:MAG: T9SS type A sorting domain-containing protein [Bacteroidales bacterium]|nr:T9SS type A sorting domain-containing protein [Bacteroidales bacterium]
MIKKSIFSVIFSLLISGFLWADGYKVLFIGNSYTDVNNLPQLIASIAEAEGDTLVFSANLPGGSTFNNHLNNPTTISLIQQGDWDYVVLQGQSQEPSFPDGQFYSETYPYAQQLCERIRQYNPEAKPVFYMTWGRKNGDQSNCPYFPPLCTYEGMDSLLYLRYMTMAADFDAEVSPVGALWHYLRDHHPEIELYASDGSHPSLAGSYAAACSFYSVLFRKDTRSLAYNPGIAEDQAENIRIAASKVVYDSLAKWYVESPENPGTGIASVKENRCVIYPNPASEYVDIQLDNQISEIKIYTAEGKLVWTKTGIDATEERVLLSGLCPGLYFIQIIDNQNNNINKKLILK